RKARSRCGRRPPPPRPPRRASRRPPRPPRQRLHRRPRRARPPPPRRRRPPRGRAGQAPRRRADRETGGGATQPTDQPHQQPTAATDLLLAALSLGCAACLLRLRRADPWKAGLWAGAFALLGVASLLGAAAHGLDLTPVARRLLWQPLNLALGLTIALFVVGAVGDLRGRRAALRLLPVMLAAGAAFFAVTQLFRDAFGVFLLYEAAALLVALAIYSRLAAAGFPGARWMVAGVLITIAAAAVQTQHWARFTLVWEFDHNGAFHLLQLPGLLALAAGVRASAACGLAGRGGGQRRAGAPSEPLHGS